MIDFFPDRADDYNIFNVKSLKEDGSECKNCAKWVLNTDSIDMFPESNSKESFTTYLEMEIQTNEVIISNI